MAVIPPLTESKAFREAFWKGYDNQKKGMARREVPYPDRRASKYNQIITFSRAFRDYWWCGWDAAAAGITKNEILKCGRINIPERKPYIWYRVLTDYFSEDIDPRNRRMLFRCPNDHYIIATADMMPRLSQIKCPTCIRMENARRQERINALEEAAESICAACMDQIEVHPIGSADSDKLIFEHHYNNEEKDICKATPVRNILRNTTGKI